MKKGIIFGVFDLFHHGHYNALLECSKYCDQLYVCVLSDKSVEGYKRKPVWSQTIRRKKIAELPFVYSAFIADRKIIFGEWWDVFFVSEIYKDKKLYCVPENRYNDIIWIPYTRGISTTKRLGENKNEDAKL